MANSPPTTIHPGPPTASQEAYQLWLKGRYHTLRQTRNEILRSRELFGQAIALDPGFARAHLGLAESWWEGASFGLDRPREAVAIGRQAILKALEIDANLGEAYAMLGVYLGVHDFDWVAAERAFRRALELSPGSSEVRTRYAAWLLEPNLRLDEARAQLDLALELDPLSIVTISDALRYRASTMTLTTALRYAQSAIQKSRRTGPIRSAGPQWGRSASRGGRDRHARPRRPQ